MPLADDLSPSGNARLLYDLRAVRHINVIPTILPTPPATLATAGTTAGGAVTTLAPAAATAVSKGARATFVPLHALVPHTYSLSIDECHPLNQLILSVHNHTLTILHPLYPNIH